MQQRQLRLGDILDDYCPRERRVTNHAVVAMIGSDVKQTRCTTCDAEHEYKHAKVPRQRRKAETPAALYSQVLASGPKRVAHEDAGNNGNAEAHGQEVLERDNGAAVAVSDSEAHGSANHDLAAQVETPVERELEVQAASIGGNEAIEHSESDEGEGGSNHPLEGVTEEEGPVHRPLIRASLPRPEGQPPPARPIPEFTIRQPGGRPNRFRPRHQRGGQQQFGNRSNGNVTGPPRGGMRQGGGGRPPQGNMSRMSRRHGPPGRKRSK
jgi:hypothetical protein